MSRGILMLGAALALGAGAGLPTPETLLREGDLALARGEYVEALGRYEAAEARATDPGRVALALAATKYHLARQEEKERVRYLRQAEQHYRCLLRPEEPRRAEALHGLGTCLLDLAGPGDRPALQQAIAAFEQCLGLARGRPELEERARHNLELARLRLWQAAVPPPTSQEPPPPGGTNSSPPESPPADPGTTPRVDPLAPQGTEPGEQTTVTPAPREGQRPPILTDVAPPPGEGNLDPVPDDAKLPPLDGETARAHLKLAVQRVLREKKAFRDSIERVRATEIPDW